MSTLNELKATERDTTLNPRQLRAAGFVPATLYGKSIEAQSIQVRAHELQQFFTQGVREFQLTGFTTYAVKIQEMQRDPVSQQPLSVQFMLMDGGAAGNAKAAKKAPQAEKTAEEAPAAEPETVLA
ncbi:MAG TPA: hypothetical protein V6C52_14185 [Coleofasciculaceae cyanobacterium]|jgi:ribosomal protein L25 (general stress protein Ctc)